MEAAREIISATEWPVFIQLLGPFNVLKNGERISIRDGGRTKALFLTLGLRHSDPMPRWQDNH